MSIKLGKEFLFICPYSCVEKGEPKDTLLFTSPLNVTLKDNTDFWVNAARDPCSLRVKKKCPSCSNNIMTKVRIEENKPIYLCDRCPPMGF